VLSMPVSTPYLVPPGTEPPMPGGNYQYGLPRQSSAAAAQLERNGTPLLGRNQQLGPQPAPGTFVTPVRRKKSSLPGLGRNQQFGPQSAPGMSVTPVRRTESSLPGASYQFGLHLPPGSSATPTQSSNAYLTVEGPPSGSIFNTYVRFLHHFCPR
jgi:hypothetical protein